MEIQFTIIYIGYSIAILKDLYAQRQRSTGHLTHLLDYVGLFVYSNHFRHKALFMLPITDWNIHILQKLFNQYFWGISNKDFYESNLPSSFFSIRIFWGSNF